MDVHGFGLKIILFFQHWDPAIPGLNTSLINEEKVNEWSEVQRSQHLLTNGASFLCGIRLQVYRAEGTTQWYTAVTTGFNTTTNVRGQKLRALCSRLFQNVKLRLYSAV